MPGAPAWAIAAPGAIPRRDRAAGRIGVGRRRRAEPVRTRWPISFRTRLTVALVAAPRSCRSRRFGIVSCSLVRGPGSATDAIAECVLLLAVAVAVVFGVLLAVSARRRPRRRPLRAIARVRRPGLGRRHHHAASSCPATTSSPASPRATTGSPADLERRNRELRPDPRRDRVDSTPRRAASTADRPARGRRRARERSG